MKLVRIFETFTSYIQGTYDMDGSLIPTQGRRAALPHLQPLPCRVDLGPIREGLCKFAGSYGHPEQRRPRVRQMLAEMQAEIQRFTSITYCEAIWRDE